MWEVEKAVYKPYGAKEADWHLEFVMRDPNRHPTASYMLIQFASNNIGEEEAKQIADNMLKGLNNAHV